MKTTKFALAVALGVIGLVIPNSLRADTMYTYTGNNFATFDGTYACTPECKITGSFTVASAIPSFSGDLTLTSWRFTDGNTIWNNSNSTDLLSRVTTDSSGVIMSWDFTFAIGGNEMVTRSEGAFAEGDLTVESVGLGCGNCAFNLNMPGTWSLPAPVPEPSSIILLGTGLLSMLGMSLYRKRLA